MPTIVSISCSNAHECLSLKHPSPPDGLRVTRPAGCLLCRTCSCLSSFCWSRLYTGSLSRCTAGMCWRRRTRSSGWAITAPRCPTTSSGWPCAIRSISSSWWCRRAILLSLLLALGLSGVQRAGDILQGRVLSAGDHLHCRGRRACGSGCTTRRLACSTSTSRLWSAVCVTWVCRCRRSSRCPGWRTRSGSCRASP